MAAMSPDKWEDFWRYYDSNLESHRSAIRALYTLQPPEALDLSSAWVTKYREPAPTPKELVSKKQLAAVWQCGENKIEDREIVELNKCLHKFDIVTIERIRHFLSQTAHESGGGRWKIELHDGSNYQGRTDLGNTQPNDGVTYAGTGYLQMTGRYNYQQFSDYMKDPRVMEGKYYCAENYPFTSAGFWWMNNNMNAYIDGGASCDQVGARVNGAMPPNGAADRRHYYELSCLYIK